jgi:DNA modification methylase
MIINGNAQSLTLAGCSVDTIVTDPPYELGFMGKKWDASGVAFDPATWAEALRVAKPGAFLLAFGGTRTWHRLACAIEDAGWIIRDCLMWMYGSGFPKSHDISKAIDKAAVVDCSNCNGTGIGQRLDGTYVALCTNHSEGGLWGPADFETERCVECGEKVVEFKPQTFPCMCVDCNGSGKVRGAEREVVGKRIRSGDKRSYESNGDSVFVGSETGSLTAPSTPLAQLWDGWGTALAPSWEPIIVAMKPLDGTFAANAERHGVAGLWIDGARVSGEPVPQFSKENKRPGTSFDVGSKRTGETSNIGRWPPNCILDEHAAGLLDEQSGVSTSSSSYRPPDKGGSGNCYTVPHKEGGHRGHNDSGGASRFFKVIEPDTRFRYVAKPSRAERDAGCYALEPRQRDDSRNADQPSMHGGKGNAYNRGAKPVRNPHPTVKPVALMRYLVRLTRTPTGGVVLDPFCGSGTTGMACELEGRDFVGVDLNPDYCELARARIAHVKKHGTDWKADPRQVALDAQMELLK